MKVCDICRDPGEHWPPPIFTVKLTVTGAIGAKVEEELDLCGKCAERFGPAIMSAVHKFRFPNGVPGLNLDSSAATGSPTP